MKKVLIYLFFVIVSTGFIYSQDMTIGGFIGYPTASLTFSYNRLEGHLGAYYDLNKPSDNSLYISADYTLINQILTLGSTDGFFWNGGVGPYLSLKSEISESEVGALIPVEFGYNIPDFAENRVDIYSQLSLGTSVLPRLQFVLGFGIGVRYRL